ncbi:MAG: CDP-alcohol phosphatidyltransferase [Atopobiaceae bacterium]
MGKIASEKLDVDYNGLADYLHANHSVYMKVGSKVYYLTDVNYESWRAQDTSVRNSKNHFVDCSDLVPTLDEFLALPFVNGHTIKEIFAEASFYPSIKGEKDE